MEKMTGSPASESRAEKNSRRVFHIFAAVIAAGFLIAGLSFFSFYAKFFHQRQMVGIQQGARADLMLMYQAEQNFHAAHGFYTSDMVALGIRPKKVLYKFGFVKPSPAHPEVKDLDPSRMDLDRLRIAVPKIEMDYSPVTKLASLDFSKLNSYCADCGVTDQTFKVVAAANLEGSPLLDIWTIDEKAQVQHLLGDLLGNRSPGHNRSPKP